MWTQGNDFTFLCLNSDTVFCSSTPENFAKMWSIEQIGIRKKKFLIARTNLLSDVFADVAVATVQAP